MQYECTIRALNALVLSKILHYFRDSSIDKVKCSKIVQYLADLSVPLHNTQYNPFNRKYHLTVDATVNDEVLDNLDKIKIYPINVNSEWDLAKEIARIANLSSKLSYRLEDEGRVLAKAEAYVQLGHSTSLFKAILEYVARKE